MPGIVLSPLARQDLEDIFDQLESRQARLSDRFAEFFDQSCRLHLRHPMLGAPCEEFGPGLRCFTVWSYVAFYRSAGDGLEIARILHAARDLPAAFQ